eukprot:PhM_4_TR11208/c0_g1_i1/m.36169/K13783/SLC37A1_2; MFS transporter, OPA family, solute carrier family 37 (glycerol-3-phosphate transporter), member 1/2
MDAPDASCQTPAFRRVRLLRSLAVAWLAYLTFNMGRKPFSITRTDMVSQNVVTTMSVGWIDTAFLLTYALGQFLYVPLRGVLPVRYILFVGLLGAGTAVAWFGTLTNTWMLLVAWALNGMFQSIGWPSCIALIGPWIDAHERGWIMGLWCSSQAIGGAVGNSLSAFVLSYGWRVPFFGIGIILVVSSFVVVCFVVDHPNRKGFISPQQQAKGIQWTQLRRNELSMDGEFVFDDLETQVPPQPEHVEEEMQEEHVLEQQQLHPAETSQPQTPPLTPSRRPAPFTIIDCLRVSGIIEFSISNFCMKIVRFTLLFWLPYYLSTELGYSTVGAGYASMGFEIGGAVGSILSGFFSDWFRFGRRRVCCCTLFVFGGLLVLLGFPLARPVLSESIVACVAFTSVLGFFVFGSDGLMTGVALQDIAERENVASQTSSLTGVVGGIGSIGSVFQGTLTTAIALHFGWDRMFDFLCLLSFIAVVSLVRPTRAEARYVRDEDVNLVV